MRKLKIYLDTSIINFVFADDVPEFKKVTIEFFENFVKEEKYLVYVSEVVIKEIEKTKNKEKQLKLLEVIKTYSLKILEFDEEADKLANVYVNEEIIPVKKFEDAQHIAIATCKQMDILLSWNFKHLANIQKQIQVRAVNEREGYFYPLTLTNPLEVIYEDA